MFLFRLKKYVPYELKNIVDLQYINSTGLL